MATVTVTINASASPTYGGRILFDTVSHERMDLSSANPTVDFDGTDQTKRVFAFFDLSTDPTSGGTITKVELLATVNSVGGTHAIGFFGGESVLTDTGGPGPGVDPAYLTDDSLYGACSDSGENDTFVASTTPSAGAVAIDLGADAVTGAAAGILADTGFFVGSRLVDGGTAGSVVFDATAGFGLRITYTAASSAPATQASNVVASNVTSSTATIGWTRGDGEKVAVFIGIGTTGDLDGFGGDGTTYPANTAVGGIALFGYNGLSMYCIYNGTGTSVAITGLGQGTRYRTVALEYNGSAGSEVYQDSTATLNPMNLETVPGQLGMMGRRRSRSRRAK